MLFAFHEPFYQNDLSFLPQGIGQIGAAIIGPTEKGPAFVPTVVRSFAEYERKFGSLSSDTFIPQTVREYLKNAGSVTVCRVLAGGGYTYTIQSFDPAFDPNASTVSTLNHNYVTGDKIYWDNSTNSGISTGIYFVTVINQTEFYLSYSGSDVFAKKYIAARIGTLGQYIYKSGWENKTLKNQKWIDS